MSEMTCERLRELGAELALGVLPGRERALAIAHLDHCSACREHVEQLTLAGDGLLGLLPGAEPPVGFETRVTNRLYPARPARPARRRYPHLPRRARLAAAAAALALAAGFGGWSVGTAFDDTRAPAPQAREHADLLQAALVADGHEVGRVYAHPGSPGWVYMSVDLEGDAGRPVHCRLVRADGTTVDVGAFPLSAGYGHWGAPAPVDPATLTGAQLLGADGTVLASAHFTPRNA
ncbi:zf-HC2 domain-containing protein [Streptomyces sp. NPDC085524]|uniref:zf-HC2 domain-containing protein n=1 Tax=Streptomyces sp. NPDC085524 TaxID=3365728 RepID=UPI0037D61A77